MHCISKFKFWSIVFSVLALAILTLGAMPARVASADEDSGGDGGGNPDEGAIALLVTNPPTTGTPYVDVQWQDPQGDWHNVDNWLIPFDQSQLGYTVNWVDPEDFGTGPFRWVLFDKQGGEVIAASDSFMFPTDTTWFWTTLTIGVTPQHSEPAAPAAGPEE
jgi:hypothetical protein